MIALLLKTAILAVISSVALSCSCQPITFEENYCSSITAVRGKILARTDNCPGTCDPIRDQFRGAIIYIVRVVKTFKGTPPEDNIMYLSTAVNDGLCGVNLRVGTTYLLTLGAMQTRRRTCPKTFWNIGLCDFPSVWKSLSAEQKSFVVTNSRTGQSLCPKART